MKPIEILQASGRMVFFLVEKDQLPSGSQDIDSLKQRLVKQLPRYFAYPDAASWRTMVIAWCNIISYVGKLGSPNEILFCLPDGAKSFLFKMADGRFVVALFRSGYTDDRFLKFLAPMWGHGGEEQERLRDAFDQLPEFVDNHINALFNKLAEVVPDQSLEDVRDRAISMAARYKRNANTGYSPYAHDIRIFALLHTLRLLLTDLRIHLLIIDKRVEDDGHQLAKMFVYHTLEPVPLRPPIHAIHTTEGIRSRLDVWLQRQRGLPDCDLPSFQGPTELPILSLCGWEVSGAAQERYQWCSCLLETPDDRVNVIAEFGMPSKNVRLACFLKDMVAAAIDESERATVQSMEGRCDYMNAQMAQEFRHLLTIYGHGLPSAQESVHRDKIEVAWSQFFDRLSDIYRYHSPGSLSTAARSFFKEKILGKIKMTKGNRTESVLAELQADLDEFRQLTKLMHDRSFSINA